jgi:hypothetical protein
MFDPGRADSHDLSRGRSFPSRPQNGCVLAMQLAPWPEPDPRVAAAIAAMSGSRKRKRPLAVDIRDRLGQWLAGESMRAALEALAAAHPAWLAQRICVPDWTRRYGTPVTSWRPPASQVKQDELAIAYAQDGYALLEAVYDPSSPPWLRELPAVDVLRRVLVQNYTRTITGNGREVIRRREKEPDGDGLPPGHAGSPLPMTLMPSGASGGMPSGWATSCTSPKPAMTSRSAAAPATADRTPRPWQGLREPGVPEPDHARGHHRGHGARQSDDHRHLRRPRREEPGPGTELP